MRKLTLAAVCAGLCAALGCTKLAQDMGMIKPRTTCSVAPIIRDRAPGCVRITGNPIVSPSLDPKSAAAAFDGDICRAWNAGGSAPRWIGVDFDEVRAVSGILLVPEDKRAPSDATDAGSGSQVVHIIEASEDGETYRPIVELAGELVSAEGHAVRFEPVVRARLLRVSTKQADHIVWREVVPLNCGAP